VKATISEASSNASSDTSSDDIPSEAESDIDEDVEEEDASKSDPIEITSSPPAPPTPPPPPPLPPPLPLIELDIRFVINGKEAGGRSTEVDVNEDLDHFTYVLEKFVKKELPPGIELFSQDVKVSYQRAYVTKAQGRKPKSDMPWRTFVDEDDYAGLLNAIRDSKASKMVIVVRAFITIPQDSFEEEVVPAIASHRPVYLLKLIESKCRLLLLSKGKR
jgi:hypothetical protein